MERRTVMIVIAEGRVLLHRRKETGLLAGMWELPSADRPAVGLPSLFLPVGGMAGERMSAAESWDYC